MLLSKYRKYKREREFEKRLQKLQGRCMITPSTRLGKRCTFEGANYVYHNTFFDGEMGFGSYIAAESNLTARIGRYCSIGPRVRTIVGGHPYKEPFVTTCPMFFSLMKQNGYTWTDKQRCEEFKYADDGEFVVVENDVWIGADVRIVQGVTIHNGAVVLAGAVVTKDVPPYSIVGGVPAHVFSYRFDEDTIRFLLTVKWWNFSRDWLKKNSGLLCNMDEFKKAVRNERECNEQT